MIAPPTSIPGAGVQTNAPAPAVIPPIAATEGVTTSQSTPASLATGVPAPTPDAQTGAAATPAPATRMPAAPTNQPAPTPRLAQTTPTPRPIFSTPQAPASPASR